MIEFCRACGAENIHALGPYRHRNPLFAGCARVRCDDCGMVFVSPMPEADALAAYNSAYFVNAHGGIPVDAATIAFHSAINRLRVAHVERFLSAQSIAVRSVLEIGAGGGHFAGHWLARHPEAHYHAIEADRSCHRSLLQLGIRLHQTPSEAYSDAGVDLVVMSHVLEHMPDPLGFLQAVAAGLRTGGALFIEVPCRDWEFKDEDEPHLLFFDKESMQQLLCRLGYRDVALSYHGQELSALRAGGSKPGLFERIRARLIRFGVVAPFAFAAPGLEALRDPLERAVVAPFQAHCEHASPAWWLRAIARKG